MHFLRLRHRSTGEILEFDTDVVRVGRDPVCELLVSGEGSEVVSGLHTRVVSRSGSWWVDDLESKNGTFLNERRLRPDESKELSVGGVIGLGLRGPRYVIEAVERRAVDDTVGEDPDSTLPLDRAEARALGLRDTPMSDQTPPTPLPETPERVPEPELPEPRADEEPGLQPLRERDEIVEPEPTAPVSQQATPEPPPDATVPLEAEGPASTSSKRAATINVMERRSGEQFKAEAGRVRIGRGKECELRPIGPDDTSVSRVHAEIVLRPDGKLVVRDAQSRNGTFVNSKRVTGDVAVAVNDVVQLGPTGPELLILNVTFPGEKERRKPVAEGKGKPKSAAARAAEKLGSSRRSFGGMGATIFFNEMFHQNSRKSARTLRLVIWSFVAVIAVGVALAVWYKVRLDEQLREQQAQLSAQQAVADSIRHAATAEYRRLQTQLDAARAGSAPRAVVESLQVALGEAQQRTTALEAALQRAQASLAEQLAAGEEARRTAQSELERLRAELEDRQDSDTPQGLLDSLRAAVRDAEERAAAIQSQVDAVRGGNLASVAQANQSAVGLVTTFSGGEVFDGSGFVITPSGYFVTNRHVVNPEGSSDSVFVTLADQLSRSMRKADVIQVMAAPGPDLALLKIRDFSGPHVPRIDWSGTEARQGEPAALIGFPAGFGMAIDQTGHVRTTMSAGIFAKVTPETINFDGFTVGGSSGSPIFSASGEVVGVHRSGLRDAVGMGFAVPISRVLALLPDAARVELGLN
jgi:pSer/pThr/pTyr-binding forkhead associated (FHA) protein/S1-C subfamily serine protease